MVMYVFAFFGGLATSSVMAVETQKALTAAAEQRFEEQVNPGPNWNVYFDRYQNSPFPNIPTYDASHLAWGQAYFGLARMVSYEGTKSIADLEYVLDAAETAHSLRADRLSPQLMDEQRDRVSPAWVSFNTRDGDRAKQHGWLVHSAMVLLPGVQAAAEIVNDSELDPAYGDRANKLIADAIETMDSFDSEYLSDGNGGGYYTDPYFNAINNLEPIPYNMQNVAGRVYLGLWRATGEERFRTRAEEIALHMKNELVEVEDRYRWRYASYRAQGTSEDATHAALNVAFIIDAYEEGIVFDDTDVRRLSNTLRNMYVNENGFTSLVDGQGEVDAGRSDNMGLWLGLTKYDAELREQIFPYYEGLWNGRGTTIDTLMATSQFVRSGATFEPLLSYADGFDQTQLAARWQRAADQPLSHVWDTTTTGDAFRVTAITDLAGSEGEWVDIVRRQAVQSDTMWNTELDFSWAAISEDATQRLFLNLLDENDDLLVRVGIEDGGIFDFGEQVVELGTGDEFRWPLETDQQNVLLQIESTPFDGLSVSWNGEPLLVGLDTSSVSSVELQFGHFQMLGSDFGELQLNDFSFEATELACNGQLSGDVNNDGSVTFIDFLQLAWVFGEEGHPESDFDCDGVTAFSDFLILAQAFPNSNEASAASVPEPSGLFQIALLSMMYAAFPCMRISRRKRSASQ